MSEEFSIKDIRKSHDLLYERGLREHLTLKEGTDSYCSFMKDADELLANIYNLSKTARSLDDYRWLSDAAIAWQVFFASNNVPKSIQLSPPPPGLIATQPRKALSEDEIEHWVQRNAQYLAFARIARTGRLSTEEEKHEDWKQATVFLVSDILDGNINFASRISAISYYRLENIWLRDVKSLRAFFRWERRGKPVGSAWADYYPECGIVREKLVEPKLKALPTEFAEPKKYLEDHYLTDGKIDRQKPDVKKLIDNKSERIARETGSTDRFLNWISAETYVIMFYQNIIPAVIENDEEKVLTVLKAFQYSRAPENGYHVINGFETALALYFLNQDIIRKLWTNSAGKPRPVSSVESVVKVQSWPNEYRVPPECEELFSFDGTDIRFKGVMTNTQKRAIYNGIESRYWKAVEDLFEQSRLIHEETTL